MLVVWVKWQPKSWNHRIFTETYDILKDRSSLVFKLMCKFSLLKYIWLFFEWMSQLNFSETCYLIQYQHAFDHLSHFVTVYIYDDWFVTVPLTRSRLCEGKKWFCLYFLVLMAHIQWVLRCAEYRLQRNTWTDNFLTNKISIQV